MRFSGACKFWAHRRRLPAALLVSLDRSSGGLTMSAGADWSKVHMYQYVHELGTRAHRPGTQRSTKGQTSHWKSKWFVRSAAVCGTTGILSRISSPRPPQEVEGPSAQPAFELQFRVGPSEMERHVLGVQRNSTECPVGREAQWCCSMVQSGSSADARGYRAQWDVKAVLGFPPV